MARILRHWGKEFLIKKFAIPNKSIQFSASNLRPVSSSPANPSRPSFWRTVRQALSGEELDYTEGSIRRAVFLLAVPMILELSLESVFAVVDIYFVGGLGPGAIATVGLTESVITVIYSLAIGLSTAATAIVARRTGEKNPEAAAHAGAQSLLIALAATLVLSIPGVIYAG